MRTVTNHQASSVLEFIVNRDRRRKGGVANLTEYSRINWELKTEQIFPTTADMFVLFLTSLCKN